MPKNITNKKNNINKNKIKFIIKINIIFRFLI